MEKSEILRYVAKQGYKPFSIEAVVAIQAIEWALSNILKDAQEDDLPEIDREVIVLVEEYGHYKVCFAHRPVESYTDVSLTNHSEIEEYYPERYDKGGWNIPNIKWWLDLDIPK